MMRPIFSLLALCLLILFSCKNESQNTADSTPDSSLTPTAAQTPVKGPEIKQGQAMSTYMNNFLTQQMWHYDLAVVVRNPEKGAEYKGKWIKFNPDHSIETGFYDGPTKKGSFTVDEGQNLLTIIEEGEQPVYYEWKFKTSSNSDDIMIFVGTPRFQLNNTQIRMLRRTDKPVRSE